MTLEVIPLNRKYPGQLDRVLFISFLGLISLNILKFFILIFI